MSHLDLAETLSIDGWTIMQLDGDANVPSRMITVGLHAEFGHPDVVVLGLSPVEGGTLVEEIVARIQAGERFDEPAVHDSRSADIEIAARPLEPCDADCLREDMPGALIASGLVQIVWPDRFGIFPWESGCETSCDDAQSPLGGWDDDHPVRAGHRPGRA